MVKKYYINTKGNIRTSFSKIKDYFFHRPLYIILVLTYRLKSKAQLHDADPLKTLYVNPHDIKYVSGLSGGSFNIHKIGLVKDGNWDQKKKPFINLDVPHAIHEHFKYRKKWEDIDIIKDAIKQVKNGNRAFKSNTLNELIKHCEYIDYLYSEISSNGYISGKDINKFSSFERKKFKSIIGNKFYNRYNDVAVDIGRNGELLFVDCRHRLAIAQVLDIKKIPVLVQARHKEWQDLRKTLAEAGSLDDLPESIKIQLEHPDLKDIVED
ncbi:hypothetical protein [Methanosalsum natronophilum]|uniref:hypothetical protein n=1 Tax=Methanosalsum natronophilum TaxID=768733 RepID=UPI00216A5E7E|nr:hypothetical protein [Methanosalsum natronophilum]MCS3924888.1 hypothetical protein [Methanosalsum natronophilum]